MKGACKVDALSFEHTTLALALHVVVLLAIMSRSMNVMSALMAQRIRRLPTEQEIPGSNPGKGSPFVLGTSYVTTKLLLV